MTFKLRHFFVLLFALLLGAAAMYMDIAPWIRVVVAAFLLVPIIYAADGLGIAPMLNGLPDRSIRHRQFGVLRSEVMQLLDVVRRLNWLTVDLERAVRPEDDVKAEIAVAERRLDEILTQIRGAAGQSSGGEESYEEWDGDEGGGPVDEADEESEVAAALESETQERP
jgi:hypothetical protein